VVVRWAVNEGLNINPHKTAMVPFTNRRRREGLGPLKLHGKELQMLDEVKYLGVTLDSKLSWNHHLEEIIRKAQTTFAVVRHTCGKNGVSDLIWCTSSTLGLSDHPYFMAPWYGGPRSDKNYYNSIRQDSKNGPSSYYGGSEIDPYCSSGGALESDSVGSADHGEGEDGTL
jgi:hypothetical protein